MPRQFAYTLQGDIEVKLNQIKAEVATRGIDFQGDTREGRFDGHISGVYHIEGHRMTVTITSKPLLAPWKNVDSRLKRLLEG
jgi:hypothetical protein